MTAVIPMITKPVRAMTSTKVDVKEVQLGLLVPVPEPALPAVAAQHRRVLPALVRPVQLSEDAPRNVPIESRWVSKPPAFAGKLRPRRLNN